MVDDVKEEFDSLLGFYHRNWMSLDPFREFVHGDKRMHVAPERFLKGPDKIKPPDREWPIEQLSE